jgi:hypothetical protein
MCDRYSDGCVASVLMFYRDAARRDPQKWRGFCDHLDCHYAFLGRKLDAVVRIRERAPRLAIHHKVFAPLTVLPTPTPPASPPPPYSLVFPLGRYPVVQATQTPTQIPMPTSAGSLSFPFRPALPVVTATPIVSTAPLVRDAPMHRQQQQRRVVTDESKTTRVEVTDCDAAGHRYRTSSVTTTRVRSVQQFE